MRSIRTVAAVLAVLVIALGVLLQSHPYLVLKVPKVGFILYAILGKEVPGYFDGKIFDEEHRWKRKGDAIIAICTKCGTTWMMQTVHVIRTKGNPPPFRDIYEEVRWAEFVYYPSQSMDERVEVLKDQQAKYQFSAFKTHKQPPVIKLRDDAKYIVGVRSPVDIAASLRDFLPNHDPEFAKMWGGFPVEAGKHLTMEDQSIFERMLLVDIGNGRPMIDVLSIDLVRGWWPHRHRKNVLFVHYQNRIRDHRRELQRVAEFLEVDLTQEEFEKVVEQTSFASMKKDSTKFDVKHVLDPYKQRGLVSNAIGAIVKDLVNSGPNRAGAKEMSPDLVRRIREKIEADFGKEIAKYLLEGGSLPDAELPMH